jgi:hypothetical protein
MFTIPVIGDNAGLPARKSVGGVGKSLILQIQ